MYTCKAQYPDKLRKEPRADVYRTSPPKKHKPLQPAEVFEGYKGKGKKNKDKY